MSSKNILVLFSFLCCFTPIFAIQFSVSPNVYQLGVNFVAKCSIENALQTMEHEVRFQHNGSTIGTYYHATVQWIPVSNTEGVIVEPASRQSPYSVTIKPLNSAAEGLYRCEVLTITGSGNDWTTTTYRSYEWNTSASSTAVLSYSILILTVLLYSQFAL